MVVEPAVCLAHDRVDVGARLDDERCVHTLFRADRRSDYGCVPNARNVQEDSLDVLRKHVQPLRRDDHLLLAAANEHLAIGTDLADVAGVEPAVFERPRRVGFVVEVAASHIFAADEDLAVRRDLHRHARDRLADRPFPGPERMIQRDDRRRFGEPVPLHDDEPQLTEERLEVRLERRRADHERPELEPKGSVNAAVPPPAPCEVHFRLARL